MDEKNLKPPYASSGQIDQLIDLLRRMTPKKIDSKFIVNNNIATATNAFRIGDFVRWVGISNQNGTINDEVMGKLKLVGEERDKYLVELIKKAYKDLFEDINLEIAKKEDIVNFFLTNYRLGSAPAKAAANLFLHLCEKYGIPLSEDLKKKTHLSTLKHGEPKRKKIQSSKLEKKQIPEPDSQRVKIPEGAFKISITGNGLDKSLLANNQDELNKAYVKLKDFVTAAAHLFPENKSEEEQEDAKESKE